MPCVEEIGFKSNRCKTAAFRVMRTCTSSLLVFVTNNLAPDAWSAATMKIFQLKHTAPSFAARDSVRRERALSSALPSAFLLVSCGRRTTERAGICTLPS